MLKIEPWRISKILDSYRSQDISTKKLQKKDGQTDKVVLSQKAHTFQIALKAVKDVPDIRMAKVEEIKARMESGQYRVSGREIAEKMVAHALLDDK
jgi:negative regulator of flagellin synthesis FlgM